MVRINGVALLEIKDPNLGLTGVKNDQMSHYFRNLPVNGKVTTYRVLSLRYGKTSLVQREQLSFL